MYPNPTPVLYPTYSQPTQTCKTPVVVQKPIEQHPPVDFKGLFGKNMLDINPPVWTDPLRELTEGYEILKNFEDQDLKNYHIVGVLGKGAYGIVYGAINDKKGVVSVKLDHSYSDAEAALEDYPNIKNGRDVYLKISEQDTEYTRHIAKMYKMIDWKAHGHDFPRIMVLEFVRGVDLYSHFKLSGTNFNEDLAKTIVRQVVLGLRSIPSGWSHRDIHPGNIIMDKNHNVKIIDFDLLTKDEEGHCFDFGYHLSPPEELRRCGEKIVYPRFPAKHSVDMWAVGLMFLSIQAGDNIFFSRFVAHKRTSCRFSERLEQIAWAFGNSHCIDYLVQGLNLSAGAREFLFGENGILNFDPSKRLGAFEASVYLGLEAAEDHFELAEKLN